ncbi:hypothetical protein P280DRAFT_295611 [Massarina eburnea CBS 473.64]|uniref:Uncharacterized protein n=1 Tax=Massarina eburnea CBS 473.64 TaxID=1395130 RepID=A0A6A6S617_9PLEO|nr:hypothetical protein P280DRAFT_295611 [Massarina eburnea CBS 473.64]
MNCLDLYFIHGEWRTQEMPKRCPRESCVLRVHQPSLVFPSRVQRGECRGTPFGLEPVNLPALVDGGEDVDGLMWLACRRLDDAPNGARHTSLVPHHYTATHYRIVSCNWSRLGPEEFGFRLSEGLSDGQD